MYRRKKHARKNPASLWASQPKHRRLALKRLKQTLHDRRHDYRYLRRAQSADTAPESATD